MWKTAEQKVGRIWNFGDIKLLKKSAPKASSSWTSGYLRINSIYHLGNFELNL